jgi:DNA replicative helicase MCM subunit Mcm2 (Cdc46/Mcm family)
VAQQFKYTEPLVCPAPTCGNRTKWSLLKEESTFVDWQRLRVQEAPDEVPPGCLPRTIEVVLRGDAVDYATVWGSAAPVAGTATARDARTAASLASSSLRGVAGTQLTTTLTVTNAGPDATAIRPRATRAARGGGRRRRRGVGHGGRRGAAS